MNTTETRIDFYETRLALTDQIRVALADADEDRYLALIEELYTLARKDAITDVVIDLADFEQTEAVEIIKANYTEI
jgi:hypothetical protein